VPESRLHEMQFPFGQAVAGGNLPPVPGGGDHLTRVGGGMTIRQPELQRDLHQQPDAGARVGRVGWVAIAVAGYFCPGSG
jgi:hypothetical protein